VILTAGGITQITGGITLTANATATLADGVLQGMRKGVRLVGAMTTSDVVVTVHEWRSA